MSQISFYHLTKTTIDEALPKLLEKVLDSDSRATLLVSDEQKKYFDDLLWSVGGTRLIPHGINGSGDEEYQPVLITSDEENKNNSDFLVLLGNTETGFFDSFKRSLLIFNGNDDEELKFARDKWKSLKANDNYELKYFFQNDKGKWQEKEQ